MIETTGDLKLKKPELTDIPDITAINPNWDKIDEEITKNKSNIGSTEQLTTTIKTSLVEAINEICDVKIDKKQIKNTLAETVEGNVLDATQGKVLKDAIDKKALKTEVGDLAQLKTNTKDNIVNAINEVDSEIGVLSKKDVALEEEINVLSEVRVAKKIRISNDSQLDNIPTEFFNDTSKKIYDVDVYNENSSIFGTNAYRLTEYQYSKSWSHQIAYSYYSPTPKCRVKHNGYWYPWEPLATTTKTDISFPFNSGYKTWGSKRSFIEKDGCGRGFIVIYVCKQDGTDFPPNSYLNLGAFPSGYQPKYDVDVVCETFNSNGLPRACGIAGVSGNGIIAIIPEASQVIAFTISYSIA